MKNEFTWNNGSEDCSLAPQKAEANENLEKGMKDLALENDSVDPCNKTGKVQPGISPKPVAEWEWDDASKLWYMQWTFGRNTWLIYQDGTKWRFDAINNKWILA
ncbi:hypothetical protein SLS58_009890 [Diplodia intermedia]|uniref:Uncharacterized protein n=1 Tax=Diplodia intermedia TaxID=856260 RepID=A0ABR3TA81_9PEZI